MFQCVLQLELTFYAVCKDISHNHFFSLSSCKKKDRTIVLIETQDNDKSELAS